MEEKAVKTDHEIKKLYKNCKYLYIIGSYDEMINDEGCLYCVSTSEDSYKQLYEIRNHLLSEGKCCVIGGSYNNGGAIGVQYEYRG